MNCIDRFIGIKDPCDNTVYSHYMDSIGITLDELNQYNLINDATGKQLFEDKKEFSWKILTESMIAHLGSYIKGNTVDENSTVGYYPTNPSIIATQNKLVGIEIESCKEGSPIGLYVSTLRLDVDFTGIVDVFVYDLNTRRLIDTLQVDAIAGEQVDLQVNKYYKTDRQSLHLGFLYDSQFSASQNHVRKGYCTTCNVSLGWANCSRMIKARGISGTSVNNLKWNHSAFGMFIDFSIQCDYELWLCGFANKLVLPLMYLIGAELMGYSIESSGKVRNNNAVLDVEVNAARRDGMMMKYHEHLNLVLKSVNIPQDEYCFNCKKPYIYV